MKRVFLVLFLIAIVLGILGLIFFYIGWNAMKWLHALDVEVSLGSCVFVTGAMILSYVASRIRFIPLIIRKILTWIGSVSFFWLEWLLILLPISNLMVWGSGMLFSLEMRDNVLLWIGWIVLAIITLGTIVGAYYARTPIIRNYSFQISKRFPAGQDSLRVLVASDLHIGHLVGRKHVQRLVDLAQSLKPDLILFAGDVLDDDVRPFLNQRIDQQLATLSAPLGKFAILGNHEYYGGGISRYVQAMEAIGCPVLQDERIELAGIGTLIGRKDLTAQSFDIGNGTRGRKTIEQLLDGVDQTSPVFMLDHQPRDIRNAEQAGVDLLVGGHTHLGQFWPNHWFTRKIFDLDYGYRQFGQTHAVVSSGWGTWGPPVRIGSQCEVVVLEVTPKQENK